jgi:hypothetical protein
MVNSTGARHLCLRSAVHLGWLDTPECRRNVLSSCHRIALYRVHTQNTWVQNNEGGRAARGARPTQCHQRVTPEDHGVRHRDVLFFVILWTIKPRAG